MGRSPGPSYLCDTVSPTPLSPEAWSPPLSSLLTAPEAVLRVQKTPGAAAEQGPSRLSWDSRAGGQTGPVGRVSGRNPNVSVGK